LGKIFISHSSANNAEALAIHDWLVEQGWGDVFLDLDPRRGLVAGDRWQAALKAAAEQCELILILISPAWAKSKWCLAEFLLAKQMNKQILGVVVEQTPLADLPVELTAEWQLVDLSAPDPGWSTTISPPRYEPQTEVRFSGSGLERLRAGLEKAGLDATTFLWPPPADLGRSPYRGLKPLDRDDAGIFFGRDGAIVLTLDALRGLRDAAAPRFVTILGASGAGKSSFLRAGILPRLGRDSRHFYVLPVIRPERAALSGEHGFAAMLETALKARNVTRNRADIRDAVQAGADAVAPILRALAVPADAGDGAVGAPPTLVIAVDQAEELLGADNAEAAAFLTLLAGLGRHDDPAVMVIFTVRSDSFDQLQARPELAATQPHHLVDLPPIPAGSFGDIIRGPARRLTAAGRKLTIDETLVDALLGDIEAGGTKDALPLLAFTLERLYTDYGADGDLQLGEYDRLGRIRGAIEAAVEEALAKADGNAAIPRDRAARLALLRRGLIPWLAGIDPATGAPRRRVARLAEVPEEARPLIDLMVEQRLLATDVDTATKETTIEPAHEALLRQWGALDGWLAEDSADLATIEALRRAASEWDANARAGTFVAHRGARLEAVEQVAAEAKFAGFLTSIDTAYLAAARAAEDAAIRKARAARTRLAIAASVVGVVLVAGATASYFIWSAGQQARTEAAANFEIARSEAALRDGRPEIAAAAALAAYDLLPGARTRTAALVAGMAVSPHALAAIRIDGQFADAVWTGPDSLELVTTRGSRTAIELAAHSMTALPEIAPAPLPMALLTGADGPLLLRADASLWRADGTAFAAPPTDAFAALAGSAAASADGRLVAMTGLLGDVLVRDCRQLPCADTVLAAPMPAGRAFAVAVAPDGSGLAVAWMAGTIALYASPQAAPVLVPLPEDRASLGAVPGLDWGRDGIVAATDTGRLFVIDPAGGAPRALATIDDGGTPAIAWSPVAPLVAVACETTLVCLFDADGARRATFVGHTDRIARLRWSADGTRLLSAASGGQIRVWTLEPDRRLASIEDGSEGLDLVSIAVDAASGRMAAGDGDGRLWLWAADGGVTSYRAGEAAAHVTSVAFLGDGRIAAVTQNETLSVWTAGRTTPDAEVTPGNVGFSRVAALAGDIRAAVPLSDRTVLVLSGDDLRQTRIAPDSTPFDHWGLVAAPAPNSAFVSYSDGTLRRRDFGAGGEGDTVFDAATSACAAAPTTDNNGSRSLDVSADGKWLVATRTDSAVIVHNLADPASPLCLALPAPDSKTVAFSPDSTRLAILSATDRLYVFDLAQPDTALVFGVPAVPENAPLALAAGDARTTSWLAWRDATTLAIATRGYGVERVALDPAGWRTRMDSIFIAE